MPSFLLYSRSYCHLCDDMLQALREHLNGAPHDIDVIDIDADEALVVEYDELVPVLFGVRDGWPPRRLCHYFLDPAAVTAFLEE